MEQNGAEALVTFCAFSTSQTLHVHMFMHYGSAVLFELCRLKPVARIGLFVSSRIILYLFLLFHMTQSFDSNGLAKARKRSH